MQDDHALYQISQIRQIELNEKRALPSGSLMRLAGASAAQLVKEILALSPTKTPKKIAILVGPGDNGGDAFEVASQLAEFSAYTELTHANTMKYIIHIVICDGLNNYSQEAKASLRRAQSKKVDWLNLDQAQQLNPAQYDLIVDGLFGIGLSRPITGNIAALIHTINNERQCPVVALDIPSGINADTGQIILANAAQSSDEITPQDSIQNADGTAKIAAIVATHTITFIANKPGLHTAQGKDHVGQVSVNHLGIDLHKHPPPYAHLSNADTLSALIKIRKQDTNKGNFGDVLVVGGCQGMQGAPLLSGRAALLAGAGRVYIALLDTMNGIGASYPELMFRTSDQCDFSHANLVLGPGLGNSSKARELLKQALQQAPTLLLDADALNLLANDLELGQYCCERSNLGWRTLLTPHPLEAARLLHCSVTEIQSDRCKAAQLLARKFRATVILKGAGSIIADEETLLINPSGNPALATAGTGDVLAGVCGTLLAQGLSSFNAASLGAFIHGLGAERCVEKGLGPIGLSASELIPEIRAALNQLVYASSSRIERS